jgi:hypothetical protein
MLQEDARTPGRVCPDVAQSVSRQRQMSEACGGIRHGLEEPVRVVTKAVFGLPECRWSPPLCTAGWDGTGGLRWASTPARNHLQS